MAPRLSHLATIGGSAAALVAVSYLPPREFDSAVRTTYVAPWQSTPERAARWRVERHLIDAGSRLALLQLRDSLVRTLPADTAAGPAPPTLVAAPDVPAVVTDLLRVSLDEALPGTQWNPEVSVAVAVVTDTTEPEKGLERLWRRRRSVTHLLPEITNRNLCLSLYTLDDRRLRQIESGALTRSRLPSGESLLGICGFWGAFGSPGSGIRTWLENSGYEPARVFTWTERSRRNPPRRRYEEAWYLRIERPIDLQACAGGDLARCRSAVEPERPRLNGRSGITPLGAALQGVGVYWRSRPLGPNAEFYLSDLLDGHGPERFGEFWRSELPLDSAFERAFDISIDEWTMEWARDQIGERDIGPMPAAGATASALLLGALLVGAATVLARIREVG